MMSRDFDIAWNIFMKLDGKVADDVIAATVDSALCEVFDYEADEIAGYGEGMIEAHRRRNRENVKNNE